MKKTITECFRYYGATLRNTQWAVSDIADGRLVVSLWEHLIHKGVYEDRLSRWGGPGNKLFRQHLEEARRSELPVKAVVAHAEDPAAVDRGVDASTVKKHFSIWARVTGAVTEFDGDRFVITFRKG